METLPRRSVPFRLCLGNPFSHECAHFNYSGVTQTSEGIAEWETQKIYNFAVKLRFGNGNPPACCERAAVRLRGNTNSGFGTSQANPSGC